MIPIDGQCHCGHITYEAQIDPERVTICHCTACQALTGSAYRVSVSAARDSFRLGPNPPKAYVKTADSGRVSMQFFCPECGSPVYRTSDDPDDPHIGIRVGTIRQRRDLRPARQIWLRSALPFAQDLRGLPGSPGE